MALHALFFLEGIEPVIQQGEGNVGQPPKQQDKELSILTNLVQLDKSKIDEFCLCMYACLLSQCRVPMGRTYADCILLL
jgi:hypothetical protein